MFLVSSGIHVRRGALYFSHFGIRAEPIRADYVTARVSLVPTAYHFLLADLALHEYLGIWRYSVYNLLGWNVKATKSGSL